ncbi:ribonuclease H-like domain-containing protein [Tanacetum coccineum]
MSQPANDEFSQHLSDDEESNHEDASDTGAAPKQQQQVIPQTTDISNIEEYDIWAMEMEHYLEYIDNEVWKVIQNGNSKKRISTGKDGIVRILSPVTAVEIQAVEKERKAKNILLMAIPKEHMRRFHGMDDAKEIWEAIRTRFGGNANSKKMQKAVFKQQFEAFKISSSEGLEKGYDRFQQLLSQLEAHGAEVSTEDANHKFLRSLPTAWSNLAMTMRTKPEVDTLSIDDLYNNLRVFEQEIQGASKTSSSAQNVAFVSQSKSSTNKVKSGFSGAYSSCTPSTSSTNIPEKEVLAGFADEVIYSLFAKQTEDLDLLHEDLEQIDDVDIEEMDINWQIAMIAIRMKKFYKKTGRRVRVDGKTPVGFDKKKLECFNCHNTGHFARECTAKGIHDGKKKRDSLYQHQEAGKQEKNQMGLLTMDDGIVNWGEHTEAEETNHALMAISSSNEVSLCSKTCIDSYNKLKLLYDEQMNQLGDQEAQILAYSQAVKKLEAQLVTSQKQQLSLNEKLAFQANEIHEKDEKLKRYRRIGMKAVKEKEQLQKTVDSWKDSSKNLWRLINSGMSSSSKIGLGYEIKSNDEVLSYEEEMNFSVFKCSKEDSIGKPSYSRFTKINDFKGALPPLSGDYTPQPQEEIDDALYVYHKRKLMIPYMFMVRRVLKHLKLVCQMRVLLSILPVNPMTVKDLVKNSSVHTLLKQNAESKNINSVRPHINTGRPNINSVRPHINTGRTNINSVRPKVNSVSPKVNSVGPKVNAVNSKVNTDRPKQPVPNQTSNSMSPKRPQMNQSNQRRDFSKSYSSVRRPFAKTTAQMSHFNAVVGNWGSAVKTSASYNWRNNRPNFNYNSGPTFIRTEHPLKNMVDRGIFDSGMAQSHDRFSWVFFLASKDETSGILQTFIRQIENQLSHRVKIIRSDNGTEFKNRDMLEFCGNKGIKQEYSTARTPQQNGHTLSVLGKFDGKSDEGFLVGYSLNSKAYRVYNLVTKRVEVNLHVNFLEDKPNVKGVGYRWISNKQHCSLLQTNIYCFKRKKYEEVELIVVPSAVRIPEEKDESRTSSTNSKKEVFSTDSLEDNPKIQAFRRELEEVALKHLGTVPKTNNTTSCGVHLPNTTGKISSPSPPQIDHVVHGCGDSLDGYLLSTIALCKSCGKAVLITVIIALRKFVYLYPEPCKNQNHCNKLMEQMSTLCDLVGQAIQKKEEEKRIAEEQAGKDRYWKIPICYDDDEDDTIGITPVLPIKEPDNNLIEGIHDKMCDVPLYENTTHLNALNKHSEIVVNFLYSDDDNSSSDDDSPYGEDIDYVDASPPDVEIVSLEGVEIVDPEVGRIDDDILLTIKDDILREKLLNVNLLIAKIDALRDNPTPSSKVVTKLPPHFLILSGRRLTPLIILFPNLKLFCFNLEEISSGSPTTHSELSLPDYKAFYIDNDHFKEKSSGSTTTHVNFSQYDSFIFDVLNDHFPNADRSDFYREEFADELAHIMSLPNLECFKFKVDPDPGDLTSIDPGIRKNVSTTNVNVPLEDDQSPLFAYVVWILLLSNVSRMFFPSPHIFSPHGNEDAFLISAFSIYHSFMPDVSHRNGTFMNQCLSKRLKGSSMRIARIMKTIDVDSQFCPFIHKRTDIQEQDQKESQTKQKPSTEMEKRTNTKEIEGWDLLENHLTQQAHFVFALTKEEQAASPRVQEKKTSAINRAFCKPLRQLVNLRIS